jgi:hypothetical protein
MKKKETAENMAYPKLRPRRFEIMLQKYGMSQKDFCILMERSPSWFQNVLLNQKTLTTRQIETFIEAVGINTFNFLVAETAQQFEKNEEVIINEITSNKIQN